jgi:hypothetical protein
VQGHTARHGNRQFSAVIIVIKDQKIIVANGPCPAG